METETNDKYQLWDWYLSNTQTLFFYSGDIQHSSLRIKKLHPPKSSALRCTTSTLPAQPNLLVPLPCTNGNLATYPELIPNALKHTTAVS